MRKGIICTLAILLMLAGVVSMASAALNNVTNPTQKGSLMVFPKVEVSTFRDTIIQINNDHQSNIVVKCYWADADQFTQNFTFKMTGNQPVWFSAKTGKGSATIFSDNEGGVRPFHGDSRGGYLQCWAANKALNKALAFNHLYGKATIVDFTPPTIITPVETDILVITATAWEYNSFNFQAIDVPQRKQVGSGNVLPLTGVPGAYDACPDYLVGDFWAQGAAMVFNNDNTAPTLSLGTGVTLWACNQDVTIDNSPTSLVVNAIAFDENENAYTRYRLISNCWIDTTLTGDRPFDLTQDQPNAVGAIEVPQTFLFQPAGGAFQTAFGRVRFDSSEPIIGLQWTRFLKTFPADDVLAIPDTAQVFEVGSHLNQAGSSAGAILWDLQPPVQTR